MAIGREDGRKPIKNPVLAVQPIVTTRRRRDIDNVLAGLKSALDGLTDAEWWNDDSDIVGITIRKPVLIKNWTRDPIIVTADEESNEDVMLSRLRQFAFYAVDDPDGEWKALCA
jgi:hypothetical protein